MAEIIKKTKIDLIIADNISAIKYSFIDSGVTNILLKFLDQIFQRALREIEY